MMDDEALDRILPSPTGLQWRADRCTQIADQVVPQYRDDNQRQPAYSCTGIYAKRWQAAWDAACIALGGDPEEYRR